FPSYIRVNFAATVAALVLIGALAASRLVRRLPDGALPTAVAVVITAAFLLGRGPGSRVELEDAHVIHHGGALYPEEYAVARFYYRGGWILSRGESLSFLAREGRATLRYNAEHPAVIDLGGSPYVLPPTGGGYGTATVTIA